MLLSISLILMPHQAQIGRGCILERKIMTLFGSKGLGYLNPSSHSSAVPSRENLFLLYLQQFRNGNGDFEDIFFKKIW